MKPGDLVRVIGGRFPYRGLVGTMLGTTWDGRVIVGKFDAHNLDDEAFNPHDLEFESYLQETWTLEQIADLTVIHAPGWYGKL